MIRMPLMRPVPFCVEDEFSNYTRRWELMEDYIIFDNFIPSGFIFDGASIPKFSRGLLSPVGILLVPALAHDYCYRYHRICYMDVHGFKHDKPITKEDSDLLFLTIANKVNHMPKINKIAYKAVKYFGRKAWNKHFK